MNVNLLTRCFLFRCFCLFVLKPYQLFFICNLFYLHVEYFVVTPVAVFFCFCLFVFFVVVFLIFNLQNFGWKDMLVRFAQVLLNHS